MTEIAAAVRRTPGTVAICFSRVEAETRVGKNRAVQLWASGRSRRWEVCNTGNVDLMRHQKVHSSAVSADATQFGFKQRNFFVHGPALPIFSARVESTLYPFQFNLSKIFVVLYIQSSVPVSVGICDSDLPQTGGTSFIWSSSPQ